MLSITTALGQIFKKLKSFEKCGIHPKLDDDTAKRILFTNRASLLILFFVQFYCIIYLFIGTYELIIISETLALGWLIILIFNSNKYYYLSRIMAVILANFTILVLTYILSIKAGIQFYFIPAALAAQFLFKPSNKLAIFLTAFFPTIFYIFCSIYITNEPLINLNNQEILFQIISNSSFSLSLFISALFAYFHAFQSNNIESELLIAKKEAELANSAKSKFISVMSHEMRTPINTIIGFTELLRQSRLDIKQNQHVSNIKTASNNLLFLVNDILDYSEIESGKIKRFNESFSIIKLMEEIQENLKPLADKKGINFSVIQNGDIAPFYHSDKRIIRTILNNLVQNALKFTVLGSVKINVKAENVQAISQQIAIEVIDTGIGFDTSHTEEIFNRFSQLSNDFNRMYGGTGLGLALVKELASTLNGNIEVASTPGKGSTFTLHINMQVSKAANPSVNDTDEQQDVLKGYKVLLAEDDEFTVFLTQKMLKDWGMEVQIAKDGLEAINACKTQLFDVVLMDIQMPNYDGIEATLSIKANSLNKATPIVGFTANVDTETRLKGTNAGMVAFIYKPFLKDDLYRIMVQSVAKKLG